MEQRPDLQGPSADDVRSALGRLLRSDQFAASPRASRFLRFVVDTALQGKQQTLKEYVLGVEAGNATTTNLLNNAVVCFMEDQGELARLEARIVLEEFLGAVSQFEPVDDRPWRPRAALHVHGPAALPS